MKRSSTVVEPLNNGSDRLRDLLGEKPSKLKVKINRDTFFRSATGKPVYAYSVYIKDPTKIVREDKAGNKTVGRLVGGRFRTVKAAD